MTHDIAPELETSLSTENTPENTSENTSENTPENTDENIDATTEIIEEKPKFTFDKFGFDKPLLKAIKKEGFMTPTPIQDLAILPLISGVDLMGIAQTGSGKTAAFCLPTMNKLLYDYQMPISNKPKVLILAPTRELVMQIGKFIEIFSRGTPIKNLVVAGGQPYQPQIRKLRFGVDILIATPGRLIDHMGSGTIKLDECHTFILDEADRMLDMGFIDDVKEVQSSLRTDHQTIMFSATMNDKVRRLSRELLKEPEYVEQVRKNLVADTITHKLMNVRRKNKAELLIKILSDENIDKALIFARTKLGADDLCNQLKDALRDTKIRVDAIHGDKKQRTREKILLNFRKGRTKVLVATDVAARGIDVDGISHVINYELPIEAENYVHRVGRTGRAGQKGLAISFCDPSDVRLLREIERLIKIKIDVDENHAFHFDLSEVRDFKKGGKGGKGKFSRSRDHKSHDRNGRDNKGERGAFGNKGRNDRGDRKRPSYRNDERSEARNDNKRPSYRNDERHDERSDNRNDNKRPSYSNDKRSDSGNENKRPSYRNDKRDDKRNDERSANTRRPARQNTYQKPDAHKPTGKAYDPWKDSQGFDDDPVLKKLRKTKAEPKKRTTGTTGNDVKVFAKKADQPKGKRDKKFAKKSAKTSFKKKNAENKSTNKKTLGKSEKAQPSNGPKQTGGHKSFAPKRKTLRAS